MYESLDAWRRVDGYFADLLVDEDDALVHAREASHRAGLPMHEVAANQGALLALLTRLAGGRRVLEIGTLGGYSTIWFDVVFIDADKPNNPHYLAAALALTRSGSLIVADNVVRDGAVVDADSEDPRVLGVRRCLEMLRDDPRLEATALQTVGAKGWDGLAMARVR